MIIDYVNTMSTECWCQGVYCVCLCVTTDVVCGLLVMYVDYWCHVWTTNVVCGLLMLCLDYWCCVWTTGTVSGLLMLCVDY